MGEARKVSNRIEGELIQRDEAPVEGANVIFKSGPDQRSVRSNAAGVFEAINLPPGRWRLVAILADGFNGAEPGLEFDVEPGLNVRGLRFQLGEASPTTIVDDEMKPISGVKIEVLANRYGARAVIGMLPTISGADGHVDFRLEPGDEVVLHHVDFEDARGSDALLSDFGLSRTTTFQMHRRGSLTAVAVRVVDQNDEPIEHATFSSFVPRRRDAGIFPDFSSSQLVHHYSGDGGYLLQVPRPGDQMISVHALDQRQDLGRDRDHEQTIRFVRPSTQITGRVTDASGKPIDAFAVSVERGTVSLDRDERHDGTFFSAQGRFSIPVTSGEWNVAISAPDHPTAHQTVTAPADVHVTLNDGRTVTGLVVDRKARMPIEAALVAYRDGDAWMEGLPPNGFATTYADGTFTLHGLPLHRLELEVSASGHSAREAPLNATDARIEIDLDDSDGSEYEGIGATLGGCSRDAGVCVAAFLPGSGARSAGLLEGDEIVGIEGASVVGEGIWEMIPKIRGPAGTLVHLQIRRGDATLEFNAVRRLHRNE
jgi:hypothetical protein